MNYRGTDARGTTLAWNTAETCVTHNAKVETPVKSVLDPSFRYTKSIDTDIRKTFARIRREQQKQTRGQGTDCSGIVLPIGQRKARAAA